MTAIDEVDLAVVASCANPKCRVKVRRFSAISTGPWWCPKCLRAKVDAAVRS